MNFEEMTGQNFLTLGSFKLQLANRGLLLIQGENADDESADSNGSGKSSLPDGLAWCLYGITARGQTGDSVVYNKGKKGDCFVRVIARDNPTDSFAYHITRYRKHAKHKNALIVERVEADGTRVDLSKGTDRETQLVVDQLIGCSADVFCASVYAGQEKMPDLPGMTDKALKALIEEAAGVEVLSHAATIAREHLLTAKGAANVAASAVASVESKKEFLAKEVEDWTNAKLKFEAERGDRTKVELSKIPPIKAELDNERRELAAVESCEVGLLARQSELKRVLGEHTSIQDEHNRLTTLASKAQIAVATATANASTAATKIAAAQAALAAVDSRVGTPCGECGKSYCEHDIEAARTLRQADIEAARKAAVPVIAVMKAARVEAEARRLEADDFAKANIRDVSEVSHALAMCETAIRRLSDLRASIARKERDIEAIKVAAKAKFSEANPHEAALKRQQDAYAVQEERLVTLATKAEEANAAVSLAENAVKVFGPAGVRAHILDTVTPFLNERTSEYLSALSDGNMHAVWSTLSKTAKGELREKFNIEVSNDKGADSFGGLSGGEKRKARLATTMALQDLVSSRATKPIGLFIGDEIDHALDESALERLMVLLEAKARDRGTVLVISHNSLGDWCDQIVTVKKSGGVSTVSGATEVGI